MKNWDPLVFLPAFAIDKRPGLLCFNLKFSSTSTLEGYKNKVTSLTRTCKLFTIDGFTTGSVVLGKVTSLKHKLGNNTVETRAFVSIAILASRELTEVPCCLGNYVIIELEDDATFLYVVDRYIELDNKKIVRIDSLKKKNIE
jgi:hypothetical protein